jgi:hypothetical protein
MPVELRPQRAVGMPELSKARIEIHIHFDRYAFLEPPPLQLSADVDEDVAALGGRPEIGLAHPTNTLARRGDKCGGVFQSKLPHNLLKVPDGWNLFPRAAGDYLVAIVRRGELLDEDHLATESPQPQRPAEAHPGLSPIEGLIGDRAAYNC